MSFAALLLSTALSYLGFALLALSQTRHWRHTLRAPTEPPSWLRTAMRVVGYAAIGASLWIALVFEGGGFGTLLWATAITVAGIAVVATLTWRAGLLRPLASILVKAAHVHSADGKSIRRR